MVRLMRTLTAVAAATLILLAGGSAADAARPTVRPTDLAAGKVIHQHGCRPGVKFAPSVTGWLMDNVDTPRRELLFVPIDNATNGTWEWKILYTCYR